LRSSTLKSAPLVPMVVFVPMPPQSSASSCQRRLPPRAAVELPFFAPLAVSIPVLVAVPTRDSLEEMVQFEHLVTPMKKTKPQP
jgi:hypothetical protein